MRFLRWLEDLCLAATILKVRNTVLGSDSSTDQIYADESECSARHLKSFQGIGPTHPQAITMLLETWPYLH